MKRRDFIKKASIATAGTFIMPYILPSGRLFAATGTQMVQHVVYVLFAGGVRWQESIGQLYLADSQMPYNIGLQSFNSADLEGNIMPNILEGAAPNKKPLYGTRATDGQIPLAPIFSQGNTLQKQGVLYKKIRSNHAGHYGGLNILLQGNSAMAQGLKQRPVAPTIFEYARKHAGYAASKVWFIGNGITNSLPLLHHSDHPDYGSQYGANFFAPPITFGTKGIKYLGNAKVHQSDQLSHMYKMKNFLDDNYNNTTYPLPNIGNTEEEKYEIKKFMKEVYNGTATIPYTQADLMGEGNSDTKNISYACSIMQRFSPNLTVLNMNDVDGCHASFLGYLQSLHRADHALAHIWNFIQNSPEMAGSTMRNNTALVVVPECGRNSTPNSILQKPDDLYGYDHSDDNTKDVFALIVGPPGFNFNGATANTALEFDASKNRMTSDVAMTVADLLGISNEVLQAGMQYGGAGSLLRSKF